MGKLEKVDEGLVNIKEVVHIKEAVDKVQTLQDALMNVPIWKDVAIRGNNVHEEEIVTNLGVESLIRKEVEA